MTSQNYIISATPNQSTIVQVTPHIPVVVSGVQGPAGKPGESATGLLLIPSVAISGHTVVASTVNGITPASNLDPNHIGKIIGITASACEAFASVPITTSGGTLNGFTGLIVGKTYYLADNGLITDFSPTSGFIQPIGVSVREDELNINISTPISLG